jgi:CDP-diacylglycerol---glycerol-3-phosphate 3-phosphatidyltransferase
LQSVAIGLLVLPTEGWLNAAALGVMGVAVVVTVVTGVDYVVRAFRLRRGSARTLARNAASGGAGGRSPGASQP